MRSIYAARARLAAGSREERLRWGQRAPSASLRAASGKKKATDCEARERDELLFPLLFYTQDAHRIVVVNRFRCGGFQCAVWEWRLGWRCLEW